MYTQIRVIGAIEIEVVEPGRRAVQLQVAAAAIGLGQVGEIAERHEQPVDAPGCRRRQTPSAVGCAPPYVKPSEPTRRIRRRSSPEVCSSMTTGGPVRSSVRNVGTRAAGIDRVVGEPGERRPLARPESATPCRSGRPGPFRRAERPPAPDTAARPAGPGPTCRRRRPQRGPSAIVGRQSRRSKTHAQLLIYRRGAHALRSARARAPSAATRRECRRARGARGPTAAPAPRVLGAPRGACAGHVAVALGRILGTRRLQRLGTTVQMAQSNREIRRLRHKTSSIPFLTDIGQGSKYPPTLCKSAAARVVTPWTEPQSMSGSAANLRSSGWLGKEEER